MTIAPEFKESVEDEPDWLSPEVGTKMMEKGFPFPSSRSTGNETKMFDLDWEEILEQLGGEDAIEATYDGGDQFTVRHLASGAEAISNGALDALAQLWLLIQS